LNHSNLRLLENIQAVNYVDTKLNVGTMGGCWLWLQI